MNENVQIVAVAVGFELLESDNLLVFGGHRERDGIVEGAKKKRLGGKVGQLHTGLGNATSEWQDQNLSNESPRPTVRFFFFAFAT